MNTPHVVAIFLVAALGTACLEVRDISGLTVLKGDLVTSKDRTDQEIEVEIRHLTPATAFRLMVDAHEVASFTTDRRGHADLKLTTKTTTAK